MSNNGKLTIGLYTNDPVIDDYIKHELQGMNILSLQDNDPWEGCQAIMLFDVDYERIQQLYDIAIKAIDTTVDVIWYVENENVEEKQRIEDELRVRGAHVRVEPVEDAAHILGMIAVYEEARSQLDRVEKDTQRVAESDEGKAVSSTRGGFFFRGKSDEGLSEDELIEDSELETEARTRAAGILSLAKDTLQLKRSQTQVSLPDVLENVVAVAGFSGAGSSFVSWNLARILEKNTVLVEGRKTGTLAAWFGQDEEHVTREQLLETHCGTSYTEQLELALRAEKETGRRELKAMREVPKVLVVDCGQRWDMEVYKRAAVRIFVTVPDPQYIGQRPDIEAHAYVLNQYPEGASIPVSEFEKRFNMKFQLIIPAQPRQVMNSIWGNRAWVLMDQENRESWHVLKGLVESEVSL
ncbi:hypothetical protein RB620_24760 [Paenibacillus sp. LHD-117]|uniref:hypothetical protein n=1 Tax=Paenibacillus sp. LHD-117 TaxID=3071412 RepID=UPI0027E0F078|nr:hypothetical protein [Paenibacillus sp. LHD-117]MDQ6422649.1 hypothetical protein [Paenibacillus sp. LHD-117]